MTDLRQAAQQALKQPEQEPVATMKMLHTYGHTTPPAAQPTYPLPDNLYESKDWQAGNYAERVEWLHEMYESKKQEFKAYLDAQRPCVRLTASTILNLMPSSIPAEHDGALMEFARDIEAKLKGNT
jgi:hypothetical protein